MNADTLFRELRIAKNNGYTIRAEKLRINEQKTKIIVNITKKKTFEECCEDFYNTHKEIFRNPKIKFFSQGDYTSCIYKDKIYYAKRYKDDPSDPQIGRVAAWARATKTDINEMVGYVP